MRNGENLAAGCRFYCSKRVAVFADMLTRYTWADALFAPAVAGLVAASKARFILEQQTHLARKMSIL